jgi:transposase
MHLDTITKLLDITNYRATEVTGREYNEMIGVTLERMKDIPPVCSGCGRIHGTSIHSRSTMIAEDMPISGKRVFLLVPKRKVQCSEDGTIRVEELEWPLCRAGVQAHVHYHKSGSRVVFEIG